MTGKQKRFCEEYLLDLNASAAAVRAGYSPASAAKSGAENLDNPAVKARIDRAMAARSARCGVNADRVLSELGKIAFCSAADLIGEDGRLKPDARPEDLAAVRCIRLIRREADGEISEEVRVELCDKLRALELVGKHLGMFDDKLSADLHVKSDELTIKFEGVLEEWSQ